MSLLAFPNKARRWRVYIFGPEPESETITEWSSHPDPESAKEVAQRLWDYGYGFVALVFRDEAPR